MLSAIPTLHLIAQIPREITGPNDPIDFTQLPNVLIYIGGPILMGIIFILWRISKRKKKEASIGIVVQATQKFIQRRESIIKEIIVNLNYRKNEFKL